MIENDGVALIKQLLPQRRSQFPYDLCFNLPFSQVLRVIVIIEICVDS